MQALGSFFQSLSRWGVVALAALTPAFFIPGGFVTVPQAKLVFISVLVGAAALSTFVASVLEGGVRIPRNLVLYVAALLPLAYITSSAIAGWPASSIVSGPAEQDTVVAVVLLFGVFLTAALVVARDASAFFAIVRALVVGICALLVLHAARLFFPTALSFGGAFPNATITAAGSWHDLGILLGAAVVLCGALFKTRTVTPLVWRSLFGATALISFLFLLIISMQDVWFVLAAVSAFFGVYAFFSAGSVDTSVGLRGVKAGGWILVALLAFVLGWFNVWIHERLPQPLQVVAVEVRPSWEGTLSVGQSSLSDSRVLLFGTGPNTFARNWAQHKPEGVNSTLFWNFDFASGVGVVPTSFVTIGALGATAWVLLVLSFLWAAGRALSETRLFDATQKTVFGVLCVIVFFFAFHVMYAPGIAISSLLFLLLGVFVSLPLSQDDRTTRFVSFSFESVGRFLALVFAGALSLGFVFASAVSLQALTSDVLVNRSIAAYNQTNNVEASNALIQQALDIWPSNDRAHRAAVELGILELGLLIQNASSEEARTALQATLTDTIDHGLAAVSIDRVDYQNWLTLAVLYQELAGAGIEGAYEQAQTAYTSAKAENPSNPVPLFRLGQLETARGNRGEAIAHLDAALAIKPDFAPAHFLRSQLLAQENRLEDAVASAAAAVQIVPEDPLGWYNLGVILYIGRSFNEAGAAFVQAVTLQRDYSNALFMLALTYHQVGQPQEASATLKRVRELNPTDQTVPRMIANIEEGKDPFDGIRQSQEQ